jgi:hypothetical protein
MPFCSAAVAEAWRSAGIDLVPGVADCRTEPHHLASAHSGLEYQFTLGDV